MVSVDSSGAQGNGESTTPAISADGRFVAFGSDAANLESGDTNARSDVFVHDRLTGGTKRVSVASDGAQAVSGAWYGSSISANGRYVAFVSGSQNLVPGDTNPYANDVFVHDCTTGQTERVSVTSDGAQTNGAVDGIPMISANGRLVAFISYDTDLVPNDTNGAGDVFVHDCGTGSTERASLGNLGVEANADCVDPSISSDGRYVAFSTEATNFAADDTNARQDVFVRDRQTGATVRASVDGTGAEAAGWSAGGRISADGRCVAFVSGAPNLVPGDLNGHNDIFVHDLRSGTTKMASVAGDGTQANNDNGLPSISGDGRIVAFYSFASNLAVGGSGIGVVYVHDMKDGLTDLANVRSRAAGDGDGGATSISANGRYVAFMSTASDLVAGDTNALEDIFVQDLQTGVIERVSMASHDPAAKTAIDEGILAIQIGLETYASDHGDLFPDPALVSESGLTPLYMLDWPVNPYTGGPMTQGVGPGDFGYTLAADSRSFTLTPHYGGSQSNGASDEPSISADGRYVAFASIATNLVSGDANGAADIFVHDRVTGATERESVSGTSAEGDSSSDSPAISADGRFVAFQSRASNLVTGDSNGTWDVFVRDRQSSTMTRVDVDSSGVQADGSSFKATRDQRRRSLCGVRLERHQSGLRRHQWGSGRLRARSHCWCH